MELAHKLTQEAKTVGGLEQNPFKAVAFALEAIPRTLAQNCGGEVVRVLTELRARHAQEGGVSFGIDGNTGKMADMSKINVWEPLLVKSQVIKTAIESSCMLLRIDDHVSGIKRPENRGGQQAGPQDGQDNETVSNSSIPYTNSNFYLVRRRQRRLTFWKKQLSLRTKL